jgi:hypothetical protein
MWEHWLSFWFCFFPNHSLLQGHWRINQFQKAVTLIPISDSALFFSKCFTNILFVEESDEIYCWYYKPWSLPCDKWTPVFWSLKPASKTRNSKLACLSGLNKTFHILNTNYPTHTPSLANDTIGSEYWSQDAWRHSTSPCCSWFRNLFTDLVIPAPPKSKLSFGFRLADQCGLTSLMVPVQIILHLPTFTTKSKQTYLTVRFRLLRKAESWCLGHASLRPDSTRWRTSRWAWLNPRCTKPRLVEAFVVLWLKSILLSVCKLCHKRLIN